VKVTDTCFGRWRILFLAIYAYHNPIGVSSQNHAQHFHILDYTVVELMDEVNRLLKTV